MKKNTIMVLISLIIVAFIITVGYWSMEENVGTKEYTVSFVMLNSSSHEVKVQVYMDNQMLFNDTIVGHDSIAGINPMIQHNISVVEGEHIFTVNYFWDSGMENQTTIHIDHDIYITTYPAVNEIHIAVSDEPPEFG